MVMEDLKECPHTVNVRDRVLYRKYLHRDGTEPSETSAIVMDYCSRGMLFRYLRQFKNERIGLVQFYFKQLVTALEAMEEKKIIHRFIINRNNSSLSLSFEIYGIPHP